MFVRGTPPVHIGDESPQDCRLCGRRSNFPLKCRVSIKADDAWTIFVFMARSIQYDRIGRIVTLLECGTPSSSLVGYGLEGGTEMADVCRRPCYAT